MFHYVGNCLALDEKPEVRAAILEKIREGRINWNHFVTLCSNHLVLPAIYLKFRDHNILADLPEELADHLQEIYTLNVTRNKQIIEQVTQIAATLAQNDIYPIFLKGSANLLDNVYSDHGERILADIDFLVREEDFFPAAQLMLDKGYKYSDPKYFHDYIDIASEKHYPRLHHPEFVAEIEIHRIPTDAKYTNWFHSEMINRDKKQLASLCGCYVPSDRNKIIHNFVHSQLSNEGYLFGRMSLREAYDLYLYSRRYKLVETLPHIKPKRKAIAYFALCRSMLGLDETFFPLKNFASRVLALKFALNQKSTVFYHTNRSVIFIIQRVIGGYFGQLIQATYSKEKRQYLLRRIKDPKWYGDHIGLYTRFFNRR